MRIHTLRVLSLLLITVIVVITYTLLESAHTNLRRNEIFARADRAMSVRINLTSIEFLRSSSICLYKKPKIIVMITSHIFNVDGRNIIRRSYPKDLFDKFNAHLIFLLAVAPKPDTTLKPVIDNEFKRHDDIIQGVFIESYRNLTYKHLMGFKWVNDFCRSAEIVVKMDDDIAVNFYKLFELLLNRKSTFQLMGHVLDRMKPVRDILNKWYVSKEEFEYEKYPEFLSGWIYAATVDSVHTILKHAHLSSFFWIDDLFVTGILRERANIKLTDIKQHFRYEPKIIECCIMNKYSCDFLAAPNGKDFNITRKFFEHLWECRYKKICSLESNIGTSCWWPDKFLAKRFSRFS